MAFAGENKSKKENRKIPENLSKTGRLAWGAPSHKRGEARLNQAFLNDELI